MIEVVISTDKPINENDKLPTSYVRLPNVGESIFSKDGNEFIVKGVAWGYDNDTIKEYTSVPILALKTTPKDVKKVLNG